MCPLPHSNQRAELFSVMKAIVDTNVPGLRDKKMLIRTDSMYTINCILDWYDKFEARNFINKDGVLYKNIDII